MTVIAEILGWSAIAVGFVLLIYRSEAGIGTGICGAVLLGLAYGGGFNGFMLFGFPHTSPTG